MRHGAWGAAESSKQGTPDVVSSVFLELARAAVGTALWALAQARRPQGPSLPKAARTQLHLDLLPRADPLPTSWEPHFLCWSASVRPCAVPLTSQPSGAGDPPPPSLALALCSVWLQTSTVPDVRSAPPHLGTQLFTEGQAMG